MKKVISTGIFLTAILFGLGVGYGTVKTGSFAYATASSYVEEITTNMKFALEQQGGPSPEEIVDTVVEAIQQTDTREFSITNQNQKPKTTSTSYIVADVETGKIILSKNINQKLPIASITKLMTAVVSDETLGLNYETTITMDAINTYGTQGNLKRGEKYMVSELMYPLLLESSNDAAEALAYAKNRPSFIADMNAKAKSIGMLDTEYDDASGLSQYNISTASDLLKLTRYIDQYRDYVFDITKENKYDLKNKTWFSNSRFRSDDEYVGGKNGFTDEALKTQIALFNEEISTEKRTIAYIILRSNDVQKDIKDLRSFVQKNIEYGY